MLHPSQPASSLFSPLLFLHLSVISHSDCHIQPSTSSECSWLFHFSKFLFRSHFCVTSGQSCLLVVRLLAAGIHYEYATPFTCCCTHGALRLRSCWFFPLATCFPPQFLSFPSLSLFERNLSFCFSPSRVYVLLKVQPLLFPGTVLSPCSVRCVF